MTEELAERLATAIRKERYFWNEWDAPDRAANAVARACLSAIEEAEYAVVPKERMAELEKAERNWDNAESAAYDE